MPKKLTVGQVEQYHRDGYVSPVRAFPLQEALAYRARLEEGDVQAIAALRPRRLAHRHDRRDERLRLRLDRLERELEGVGQRVGCLRGVVQATALGRRALQQAVRDAEADRVRDQRLLAVEVRTQVGGREHLGDVVEIVRAAVLILARLLVR